MNGFFHTLSVQDVQMVQIVAGAKYYAGRVDDPPSVYDFSGMMLVIPLDILFFA